MSRTRQISIVIVLILANYLVLSNLGVLLFTAGNAAVSRPPTRTPRPTFTVAPEAPATPIPLPPTDTPVPPAPPTNTPAPTNTSAPANTPAPGPAATATPTANATPTTIANPAAIPTGPANPIRYPFRYTVQAGDSLSVLADRFLVPRAKIMAANGLTDANLIRVGQVLIIPDPKE